MKKTSKPILISLSVLSFSFLTATIIAPTAILNNHETKMQKIKSNLVSSVKLTSEGQETFNKLANGQSAFEYSNTIKEYVSTEKAQWLSWFEAVNGNNVVIDAIEDVISISITMNSQTMMHEAHLEIAWKNDFIISNSLLKNSIVTIRQYENEKIELTYDDPDAIFILTQNIIFGNATPIKNLEDLNKALEVLEYEWNNYTKPDIGPQTLGEYLEFYEVIEDGSKIGGINFEASQGLDDNSYNITWKFKAISGFEFINGNKNFVNLLGEIPPNSLAFTSTDKFLIERVMEPFLKTLEFTDLESLNALLPNSSTSPLLPIQWFVSNPNLVEHLTVTAEPGDGVDQYDMTVIFNPFDGQPPLVNGTKIFENVRKL